MTPNCTTFFNLKCLEHAIQDNYRPSYTYDGRLIGSRIHDLWNGAIFNDLDRFPTQISKSRHYSTTNVSETIQDRHVTRLLQTTWTVTSRMILNDLQGHFSDFV